MDLDRPGLGFSLLPGGPRLAFEDPATAADLPVSPAAAAPRPNWLLTSLVSGGALVGSALNSVFDGSHQSYHLGDGGGFGRDTHFRGADKAAHLVDYYIVSKESATIRSAVMMLEHMGYGAEAERLETAVARVYRDGEALTPDQGGTASTRDMARAVLAAYRNA